MPPTEGTEREPAEPDEPVVSHLADKDPVPPLCLGMLLLGVLVIAGMLAHGGMPWSAPLSAADEGEDARIVLVLLLGGSFLAWSLIGWGLVITVAKVDDIWEMLRAQRPEAGRGQD